MPLLSLVNPSKHTVKKEKKYEKMENSQNFPFAGRKLSAVQNGKF